MRFAALESSINRLLLKENQTSGLTDLRNILKKENVRVWQNSPPILLAYQQRWLADKSKIKIAEKSRRIGYSWADAAESALEAARALGCSTFYVGYNREMAQQYIKDVAYWAQAYQLAASEIQEEVIEEEDKAIFIYTIRFVSGHEVSALSSRPANLRSKKGRIRIDEAAFHEDLEELVKAALAIVMWGGQVAIWSTHDGEDNYFNQLIEEVKAGSRDDWSHHKVTLDDAIADGLYKRICLVQNQPWTLEGEFAWRSQLYKRYGDGADEELGCIPKRRKNGDLVYSKFDRYLNDCNDIPRPSERLHIGMDFNVTNMSAVIHVVRDKKPRAIAEIAGVEDTPAMITAIRRQYPNYKDLISVYPDASGQSRKSTNAASSDVALLRQAGFSVVVNASNPSVKDRVNAMNTAFCDPLGTRDYLVNTEKCPHYAESLEKQLWKNGEPDKTQGFDHLCFAAETRISTPDGYLKISEMAESGLVYSANSEPVPYHSLGITKTLAKTVKVTLSSGKIYRCTPNHLFLTTDGWVPAQFLSKRQLCKTIQPSCQKTSKSSKAYRTTVEMKEISTSSESLQKPIQTSSICIERCGSTIMGKYLKATKSITKTKILPTTRSIILSYLQPKNTLHCIEKNAGRRTQTATWLQCVNGLSWLNLLPKFGMAQKKVETGIGNTRSLRYKKTKRHSLNDFVLFAVRDFAQAFRTKFIAANHVKALVSLDLEESQESITRRELALCAQSLLSPTDTPKREHALNLAVGDYVLSVEPDKDQDVYCMTVPYWGCFALDEGFLVSNCDAGGYFIVKFMPIRNASGSWMKALV